MLEKLKRNIENSNLSNEDKKIILKLLESKREGILENSLTTSTGRCPTCGRQ